MHGMFRHLVNILFLILESVTTGGVTKLWFALRLPLLASIHTTWLPFSSLLFVSPHCPGRPCTERATRPFQSLLMLSVSRFGWPEPRRGGSCFLLTRAHQSACVSAFYLPCTRNQPFLQELSSLLMENDTLETKMIETIAVGLSVIASRTCSVGRAMEYIWKEPAVHVSSESNVVSQGHFSEPVSLLVFSCFPVNNG